MNARQIAKTQRRNLRNFMMMLQAGREPPKLGRLSTNPTKRNLSLATRAGVTLTDLAETKRTKKYADGRQKFTLSHLGRKSKPHKEQ